MRKLLSIITSIAFAMSCYADGDIPSLNITTADGTTVIALKDIISIKYTGEEMLVTKNSGSTSFSINDVSEMLFGTTTETEEDTAIDSIEGASINIVLYDLNGRIVFKGTKHQLQSVPQGIYLMKNGHKTIKVVL